MSEERVTIYPRRKPRERKPTEAERIKEELRSALEEHPPFTAIIRYQEDDEVRDWVVEVDPARENDDTMRKRLWSHSQRARFLGYAMK